MTRNPPEGRSRVTREKKRQNDQQRNVMKSVLWAIKHRGPAHTSPSAEKGDAVFSFDPNFNNFRTNLLITSDEDRQAFAALLDDEERDKQHSDNCYLFNLHSF